MATESRQLFKIEAISSGDGHTRFFFGRVGRSYYVDAQNVSEASRRRMERVFQRAAANIPDPAAMAEDTEFFFGTNGVSIGLWVHQEVSDGD